MIPELLRRADEVLSEAGSPVRVGDSSYFLYTNSGEKHSSLLLFVFPRGYRGRPKLVIKIGYDTARLEREARHLRELHRTLGSLVPRPWGVGCVNRYSFLVLDTAPGAVARDLRLERAMDVLLRFQTGVRTGRPLTEEERHSLLVRVLQSNLAPDTPAPIRQAASAHGSSIRDALLCASVEAIPQHGDFSPANLLEHRGRFTLIDWESYALIPLPYYDLFSFFLSVYMGGEEPCVIRLAREHELRARLHAAVRSYSRALGLETDTAGTLFPVCLLLFGSLSLEEGRSVVSSIAREVEALFSGAGPWAHPLVRELMEAGSR